uniref:Uncharacterized protein n=1 Tax=Ditylenchus dipsaci TaxID=166011 RepID=A0A915EQW8_9BILA
MALSMGVTALCKLDPQQLFKRLESVCTEHVMTVKEVEYLKQFGVTWSNVNYHIFDKIIYQDELFRSFVPHMEAALQVKLTGDGPVEISIDKIPPAPWPMNDDFQKQLPELLSEWEMFRRADLLIQAFIDQQTHLRNRTKMEILEKDLEFFTEQRRMMQGNSCFPCTNMDHIGKEDCDREIDAADEAEFVRRFKELFNRGPENSDKCVLARDKGETVCKYCDHPHCSCDECGFYHMILCGLIDCGIDCMVDVVNFHMEEGFEEMHADEEQLLCSGVTFAMDSNCSLDPEINATAYKQNQITKEQPIIAFKEVKRTVEESAEDEKVNTEMILGYLPVYWNPLHFSLYTRLMSCANKCLTHNLIGMQDWNFLLPVSVNRRTRKMNTITTLLTYHYLNLSVQTKTEQDYSRKSVLMKRAKSSTAAATLANTVDGQCYISEDKKSVVHVDKKGICVQTVTQITKTKTTPRGKFLPKRAKQASSNGTAEQADNNDSNEDSNEISGDEKSETEAADIQRISEKIVQEIERSFDNGGGVFGSDLNNGSDKFVGGKGKGCFSSFIKPDCRKLIESLMRRQNSDANTDSTQPTVCEEEEDTCDSHSVDLSEDDECEHDHDSCSTQSGDGDNRDRYSRCDCCYCTYLSGDTPSRHDGRRNEEIRERLRKVLKKREKQWDADRGHSLSSDVRDRVSEAETKVEIKNDVLSSSKAAKKARQKQRKLEEKKRAEEEDCAKRKALEEEKAKKEAELAAENAKKIQEEKSKSKRRQKQKQQAEAEMKKVAVRDLSDSAITEDTSKDKDQMFSANAANKARQQQKKLEEKKKHEEERQRKLADERQRQEAIKKEKAEKEARLQDEKRKRLEEQRQAKLEKRLEKVEKNKAEKEKSRNVVQAKLGQSKDIITEHKEIASEQTVLHQETHAETPSRVLLQK